MSVALDERGILMKPLLDDTAGVGKGVNERPRRGLRHNAAVGIAAAEAKYREIAWLRIVGLVAPGPDPAEIFFTIVVKHPVRSVGPRIEGLHKPNIDKYPHDQHAAVDTDTQYVGAIVIGRAKPSARFRDDSGALRLLGGRADTHRLYPFWVPPRVVAIGPVMTWGGGT